MLPAHTHNRAITDVNMDLNRYAYIADSQTAALAARDHSSALQPPSHLIDAINGKPCMMHVFVFPFTDSQSPIEFENREP